MNDGAWTKIQLASGDLWNDRGRSRPLTVACEYGVVWLTHEREGRDIILTPGARFVIAQDGLAVVQSLTDALISVVDGDGQPETLNANIRMIGSNNTGNDESEQKRNNRRSIMKRVTMAVVASIVLTWVAVSSGDASPALPATTTRTERTVGSATPRGDAVAAEWASPYDAAAVEQISLWLGVGLSVLMVAYFVVEVIEDRKSRAMQPSRQPFVRAATVSEVQVRKPVPPGRFRLVWNEASRGASGAN